jgi:magnesium-transporting ATPase (P-type)
MLKLPGFSASIATYGLGILILFGGFLYLPQYLQLVKGLTPLESGLWTLPWATSFVVGSLVTPLLVKRFPAATLMFAGMIGSAVGFAMFTVVDVSTSFFWFASGSFVFALGMAPVFTLTNDLIIGSAPPERAGAASAMAETGAEFGGAIGIAVFGTIGLAIYRAAVADSLPMSVPVFMGACTLGVVAWAERSYDAATAATMGWTTFVLAQLFNVFNARSERTSTFRSGFFTNRYLWISVISVAVAQLAIVKVEWLRDFFEAAYLTGGQFWLCVAAGSVVLWLEELRKVVARRG